MAHNTGQSKPAALQRSSRMKFSLSHGIETWFDVDDITIRVWASAWSGKEIVRIEDGHSERIVSEKRSFRFLTPHEFSHGGHRYRVEIRITLGIAEIKLFRDGVQIDSDLHVARGGKVDPVTGKVDRRAQLEVRRARRKTAIKNGSLGLPFW